MINEKSNYTDDDGKLHRHAGSPLFTVGKLMDKLWDCAAEVYAENVVCDTNGEPPQDIFSTDTADLTLTAEQFLTAAARAAERVGQTRCLLCGVDTREIGEMYHLRDELWESAVKGAGMLCIGCVERVLGRRLTPADFTAAKINHPDDDMPKSDRLRSRLA